MSIFSWLSPIKKWVCIIHWVFPLAWLFFINFWCLFHVYVLLLLKLWFLLFHLVFFVFLLFFSFYNFRFLYSIRFSYCLLSICIHSWFIRNVHVHFHICYVHFYPVLVCFFCLNFYMCRFSCFMVILVVLICSNLHYFHWLFFYLWCKSSVFSGFRV